MDQERIQRGKQQEETIGHCSNLKNICLIIRGCRLQTNTNSLKKKCLQDGMTLALYSW